MEKLPKTPREAKSLGEKYYFTGVPCKRGHICARQASNAVCVECNHVTFSRYYGKNTDKLIARAVDKHEAVKDDPEYRQHKADNSRRYYHRKRGEAEYEHFLSRIASDDLEAGL